MTAAGARELLRAHPQQPNGRPPLLFLHGLAHGAWCWAESWLQRAASRGWESRAISLKAHGGSPGRDQWRTVRLGDYVDDVLTETPALGTSPVLVAHSLGCVVAAQAAARHPYAAVVLLVPVGVTQGVDLLARTLRRAPGHVARIAVGRPLRLSHADLYQGLDEQAAQPYLQRLDPEPPLVQLQIVLRRPPGAPLGNPPVLVYGAVQDELVPAGGIERTARYYGVRPRWLPDVGHAVMLDAASAAVLDRVLDDLETALDRAGAA